MLSLRTRLTIYYLAILSAVLIFFGFAIHTYLSRSLLSIIDGALVYQVKEIERQMMSSLGDFTSDDHPEEAHSDQLMIAAQVVQIIDSEGRIRDETGALQNHHLPVDPAVLSQIKDGDLRPDTIKLSSGEQIRLITKRAVEPDGDVFFIRAGQSLKPLQEARRRLTLLLLVAVPIALLLGSYGGLLLANQALRPVDRITNTAAQISASDLAQRVPLPEKMDEIGRLAKTFNHMIARLQAAFERQRQFTSDASHELRTPLAVMRGEIEVSLRRTRSPQEYERVLQSNLEEIHRLSRLVEDLLTLARGDSGQVTLQLEPVVLDHLCRQTAKQLLPLAEGRGQTLLWTPPEGHVLVNGDPQRLKQLLLNLLDNAMKYTPQGGRITLGLGTEGKEAVLTVADTGRGIATEDLPHIFERFFRHSRSTSDRSVIGFGLGLSIVKWIVDSHGGKIGAQSKVGEGTTFTVRLPLLDLSPDPETQADAQ
ncbi:MAG TPA: heavy metal sensor histidine kinase [Blastocatellia bacterium]|nr:heavy metal sensor histidine kinase [Blastocatellia bacterium]